MANTNTALADRFVDGIYEQGLPDVLRGLLSIPRRLSHTWLYDERGSRLFERICDLPEYYVTRVETAIMRAHARDIAAQIPGPLALIEYGSGNSAKTRMLLDALPELRAYVPIDIATSSLARATRALRHDYPRLPILPLCADFTRTVELPPQLGPEVRRLVYFPGSTLGNYEPAEARRLLASMRALAGPDGLALIGIDLVKPRAVLERAYDDARGVTAEFNLNALRHVNRRLGIGFDISQFRHRAIWVDGEQRIEMHLVSAVHQAVRVGGAVIRMLRGDFIRTECCHKYSEQSFARLAADAGWRINCAWSDENRWFGVQLLAPA